MLPVLNVNYLPTYILHSVSAFHSLKGITISIIEITTMSDVYFDYNDYYDDHDYNYRHVLLMVIITVK